MLPLTLQFLIAMIASAINERTKRKLDYALEEVQVVKEAFRAATGKERIPFTPDQRRRLAVVGKELSPEERRQCRHGPTFAALSSRNQHSSPAADTRFITAVCLPQRPSSGLLSCRRRPRCPQDKKPRPIPGRPPTGQSIAPGASFSKGPSPRMWRNAPSAGGIPPASLLLGGLGA